MKKVFLILTVLVFAITSCKQTPSAEVSVSSADTTVVAVDTVAVDSVQ